MIITFEGLSRAGKTTQALTLCSKIGFELVDFFEQLKTMRALLDPVHEGDRSHLFPLAANTMLLNSASESNRKNVVIHDPPFLSYLHPFFVEGNAHQPFIQTWLDWFDTTYLVPVVSFCLKVDYDTVNRRMGRRLYDNENTSSLYEFYDYLDEHLRYFHIIDGTKDVDDISTEIEQILRGIDGSPFLYR